MNDTGSYTVGSLAELGEPHSLLSPRNGFS
jgi:hypothetical protein